MVTIRRNTGLKKIRERKLQHLNNLEYPKALRHPSPPCDDTSTTTPLQTGY